LDQNKSTHRAAFDDLRVLDLSEGLAGPLCARILADHGAEVIKVERPAGDAARRWAPFLGGAENPERSLLFHLANLNKSGLRLDYTTPEGAAILRRIAAQADVIVESARPGDLARLGLDHATLAQDNPGLITVSITPFGQTGPYAGFQGEEVVTYAMSGVMSFSGEADREPLKHGGMQSQYEGGLSAATAAAAGIYARDVMGHGQHIDISLQDVVTSTLVIQQPFYSWGGAVQGRKVAGGTKTGQIQPCKDGYFIWQMGGGRKWPDIAPFFGHEKLFDERFDSVDGRTLYAAEIDALITEATADREMKELFRTASEKYRMLFGIAQEPKDLLACEHLAARDFFQSVEIDGETVPMPFRMWSATEGGPELRSGAPRLGEHNSMILQDGFGLSPDEYARLQAAGIV